MKHSLLQKRLDKLKWIKSEQLNHDCSGLMEYCAFCQHRKQLSIFSLEKPQVKILGCLKDQEHREKYSLCAEAYNKMCKAHTKEHKNG